MAAPEGVFALWAVRVFSPRCLFVCAPSRARQRNEEKAGLMMRQRAAQDAGTPGQGDGSATSPPAKLPRLEVAAGDDDDDNDDDDDEIIMPKDLSSKVSALGLERPGDG